MRLLFGIVTGLIMLLIIGIIITMIAIMMGADPIFTIGTIIITWAISYFKLVFPYCFFETPQDKAWIIANPLTPESAGFQSTFSGYREIRGQWETQAGYHWKYPWEKPNWEVDMTRQIPLENGVEEVYTLAEDQLVIIRWRIFYGPLPGSIVNFIKTKPEYISTRIRDRVVKFLQGIVGEKQRVGYDRNQLEEFRTRFEKVFGGPNEIDAEERSLGIWTGTPEILDIDKPRSAQEITAILKAASDAVRESNGKMTFEEARGIILASKVNGTQVDILEIARSRK